MISQVAVAAVSYAVGAFTPAVGRRIKALFVKEVSVVKTDVVKEVSVVKADVVKKL